MLGLIVRPFYFLCMEEYVYVEWLDGMTPCNCVEGCGCVNVCMSSIVSYGSFSGVKGGLGAMAVTVWPCMTCTDINAFMAGYLQGCYIAVR